MSVAAIIPCYNVDEYVAECVQSVLAQRTPFAEVILLDDGSTDQTLPILRQFEDHPAVSVHAAPTNRGLGAMRNLGMELSHSQFICFIDADDLVSERLVESFSYALRQNSGLDLYCYAADCFVHGDRTSITDGFYYRTELAGDGPTVFSGLSDAGTLYSCAVLYIFDRQLVDWLGGFPEVLHEDETFTPLLQLRARHAVVDPAVLYHRRLRPNSIMSGPPSYESMRGYAVAFRTAALLLLEHRRAPALRRALSRRLMYLGRILLGHAKWLTQGRLVRRS
jgi:glycosyltransferase involved in cell wall biosynthesis